MPSIAASSFPAWRGVAWSICMAAVWAARRLTVSFHAPRGGLFAWSLVGQHSEVILVEGLLDLAVLWQAGFLKTSCAFGVHLTEPQFAQLTDLPERTVWIAFDADRAGQNAAHTLGPRLQRAGLKVRIVDLPAGQDPNRYFVDGASAEEFGRCLRNARCP